MDALRVRARMRNGFFPPNRNCRELMLTKLTIRNFKRLGEVEIELGSPVVFIGPDHSDETSAMQALALWNVGLMRWNEKRSGKSTPEKRPGVSIDRRDLDAIPVSEADILWQDLNVRDLRTDDGRQRTSNVRIEIIVEGGIEDRHWRCGLEFDYTNDRSFDCMPLRLSESKTPDLMPVPDEAGRARIAYLSPLSGLAETEPRLDVGAVNERIREGRAVDVLRNLCFQVHRAQPEKWNVLDKRIQTLFGLRVNPPRYIEERGVIAMTFGDEHIEFDLASADQGLHQTLLLLAYMYSNPGAVLLMQEPDAHLEILRQDRVCGLLTDVARESGSQIIASSHTEVRLSEIAGREVVFSFDGGPHPIDDDGSDDVEAPDGIGFEQQFQAQLTGWVLYLESSKDLSMLQTFARRLGHKRAVRALERPFVKYVLDQPAAVRPHFHGLREAVPTLRGVALFDRLESESSDIVPIQCLTWTRRVIENYVCSRATLEAYATGTAEDASVGPLFTTMEVSRRQNAMRDAIAEVASELKALGRPSPWSEDIKARDEFLAPLFASYFKRLDLPNLMARKDFHELAEYVPQNEIDAEVCAKLDAIADVADNAAPGGE